MAKLLLVEDDKNLREIYGTRLSAEGYTIISAGDGEEALALAIKEKPDLIISDVMMPKISGFDMLDILRSTTETRDVKVIMMTALSSEDQRKRGEALGADRYLVKSQVGIEDVVATVHDVLGDAATVSTQPTVQQSQSITNQPVLAQPAYVPPAVTPIQPAAPAPAAYPLPPTPVAPAPQPIAPTMQPVLRPAAPIAPAPRPVTPVDAPAPAAFVPPVVAPTPIAAPQPVTPVMPPEPATPVTPTPATTYQPTVPVVPAPAAQPPVPSFAPEPVQLPQPTAPFSTPRPRNLGDRIIQPIEQPADPNSVSVADQMSAALDSHPATMPTLDPATSMPPIAPVPAPVIPPTPGQPAGLPPLENPAPLQPFGSSPVPDGRELHFEETPRDNATPTTTAS